MATATGLSNLLKGKISHDKITRHLSASNYDSKSVWKKVKPMMEEISSSDDLVVICFDDSIEEKRYTDESELISWHFDHTVNRAVKGVNFLTALINTKEVSLPCAVEFVKKDKTIIDPKTSKKKRISSKTKNEMYREMLRTCDRNVNFDYVLNDSWYSTADNMKLIKKELKRNFIMALKSNRKVAWSKEDKEQKKYIGIRLLPLEQQPVEVWLEELDFPLLLTKQVFKNEDGTVGELYLVCSDLNLSYEQIATIYKRRWSVEVYHKSVKSNASFSKSPTKLVRTQTNHFMLAIIAYVKLEWLQLRNNLHHFAMKSKIYICALQAAMKQLKELSTPLNQRGSFA